MYETSITRGSPLEVDRADLRRRRPSTKNVSALGECAVRRAAAPSRTEALGEATEYSVLAQACDSPEETQGLSR